MGIYMHGIGSWRREWTQDEKWTTAQTLRELISKTMRMESERGTRSFDTRVSTCCFRCSRMGVWVEGRGGERARTPHPPSLHTPCCRP